MEEGNKIEDFNLKDIFCKKCNDLKKIKINYNGEQKVINVVYECSHEREENTSVKNDYFCFNCKKFFAEKNKDYCKKGTHIFIKGDDFSFYCPEHFKKYSGYCIICQKNLCQNCLCEHDEYKEKIEYYFTKSQIKELKEAKNKAFNFIGIIYSIQCKKKIERIFNNYLLSYKYMKLYKFFHINIIHNINTFYSFFILCINNKPIGKDTFISKNINNIPDSTIFYDEKFLEQYSDLQNLSDYENIFDLFCLSKRVNINKRLYNDFANEANFEILNIKPDYNPSIFFLNFSKLETIIQNLNLELKLLQNEVKTELLSLKLTKKIMPQNQKRILLNILQREIIKKYSPYLHKVKSCSLILNSIKNKYELLKKQNNNLFDMNIIEQKLNEIKEKVPEIDIKDNIYFQGNFEQKTLLNTFLLFSQKLYDQKNNFIHYSNFNNLSFNEITPDFLNYKDEKKNVENESLIYNNKENGDAKKNDSTNNDENCSDEIKEYKNYLISIQESFVNVYFDIYIKEKLKINDIIDALFNNNYLNIIDANKTDYNNKKNNFVNNCLNEFKITNLEKLEEIETLEKECDFLQSNDYFREIQKIISILFGNRKYENLVEKLSFNNPGKNECALEKLQKKLMHNGGFDRKTSNSIVKLLKTHFSYDIFSRLDAAKNKLSQYKKEYSYLKIEIRQLEKIKDYIYEYKKYTKYYNDNFELNEMNKVKDNFERYINTYIKDNTDKDFIIILKEINEFIKGKDIKTILDLIKENFINSESKFFLDDSINLLTYCWGLQNGYNEVL